ncbi:MAG: dTDP-glucose 4,6-dehydratase [Myxococcales bacterium]|nr:MAG: dTDP-glucose 4,6-dehydratase [Myxococcales bacterium]
MRLLVTGGAGFIGSNFVQFWLDRHPADELVVFDALTYAGNLENLSDLNDRRGYRFVKGRIEDAEAVRRAMDGGEVVVHFAAESFVDRSIVGPQVFVTTNVVGSQVLFDAAREAGVRLFVHVSTDEVYGSLGSTGRFSEETPYAPGNPYSASKAASDLLALAYYKTFGFPVVITHGSNNYGPYQFPEKFIPLFILRAMEGKPLPLYGDGLNVRDWIHVRDHCLGLALIVERGKAGETYNFGGDCERTNLEIARRICELAGRSDALIQFVKDRPGHDRRYAIDYAKAARELGFAPTTSIEAALPEVFRWYADHEPWWRHILSGEYQNFYAQWYAERGGGT